MGFSLGIPLSGAALAFTPTALFAAAEQGGWYDPSDLSTLYQDSAGATRVTAAGQPVGKMLDTSGRGNHLLQAISSQRPTYQVDGTGRPHLLFDGVDDALNSASTINCSALASFTVVSGFYLLNSTYGSIVGFSDDTTGPGWKIRSKSVQLSAAVRYRGANATLQEASFPVPNTPCAVVASGIGNLSTPSIYGVGNGVAGSANTSATGGGTFGTSYVNLGYSPNYQGAYCRFYGAVIRFAISSVAELLATQAWMNGKTGAY